MSGNITSGKRDLSPLGDALYPVDYALIAGATLSLLCCLFIAISYCRARGLRRHPNNLIFFRTLSDVVLCSGILAQYIILEVLDVGEGRAWVDLNESGACRLLGFTAQFMILAAEVWFFTVSLDLYRALENPFTNSQKDFAAYAWLVFIVSLGAAIVCQISFGGATPTGMTAFHLCWIQPQSDSLNFYLWTCFYMPVLGMYLFGMTVLRRASRRLKQGLRQTYVTRRRVFERSALFMTAYVCYWFVEQVLWVSFFAADTLDESKKNVVNIAKNAAVVVFNFIFASRSVVTLFLWFRALDLRGALRSKSSDEDEFNKQLQPHLNKALRQEVLHYTRAVIRLSVLQAEAVGSTVRASQKPSSRGLPNILRAPSRAALLDDWKDLETDNPVYANLIDGLNSDETVHTDTLDAVDVEIRGSAHSLRSASAGAAGTTPSPRMVRRLTRPPMTMQDLAPRLFSQVRAQFNISADEYVHSLSKTINERFSEGASGAFMCFSHDKRFVVKTMSFEEANVLRRILPKYVKYMKSEPETLISKFFGCCALKLYKQQLYFVVMENIFDTSNTIHERYDLKGSWENRNAGKVAKGAKTYCRYCNEEFRYEIDTVELSPCRVRPNRPHTPSTVLKDNDLNFKIRLDEGRATKLGNQLRKDARFLCDLGIMDYSLLMGVSRRKYRLADLVAAAPAPMQRVRTTTRMESMRSPRLSSSSGRGAERVPFFREEEGGIMPRVIEGPGVFYLGLIDILQTWTWEKRAERFIKILRGKSSEGISAVEPAAYYRRFEERVVREVIDHKERLDDDGRIDSMSSSASTATQVVTERVNVLNPLEQQRLVSGESKR